MRILEYAGLAHGKFYRAKLDDADRLLFSLVRHGDEVCALMLEVIANHDYDKSRFMRKRRRPYAAFESQAILEAWQHLPANVVRPERNKRHHLSGVLSRNEVERDYAYNRALFQRVTKYRFTQHMDKIAADPLEDWAARNNMPKSVASRRLAPLL